MAVLAQLPDPRRCRGVRHLLTAILTIAVIAVLAGAQNFREIGDHVRDLPQEILAQVGAR
jgi:DDE_Tnp_1-associated